MKMRHFGLLAGALVCLNPCGAGASQQAGRILPDEIGDWKAAAVNVIAAANAEQVNAAQADVLREYGLKEIEEAEYARGNANFQATLYEMEDPTGAYGWFTFLRTPDMHSASLGDYSDMNSSRLLVLRGNLLLEVEGEDLRARMTEIAALQTTVTAHAELGPYPTLDLRLPREGLEQNSQRYIVGPKALQALLQAGSGDWAGFSHGAEAVLGRYRAGREDVTLLLVDFPTPQAAATELENYGSSIEINPAGSRPAGENSFYARRDFTLVGLVKGARSPQVADQILERIHSGEEVTWDEATLHNKPKPNDVQILIGIFTGTGILCAYALIAGLAFGGMRLVLKRMLPGRVFDRDTSVEILQLGITTKPIEGSDFFRLGPPR